MKREYKSPVGFMLLIVTKVLGHLLVLQSNSRLSDQASDTHFCHGATFGPARLKSDGRHPLVERAEGTAWPASSKDSLAASASSISPPGV